MRYVVTNLSIALLACAAVGLALFFISSSQLNAAILRDEQNSILIAANDLETQYKTMQEIAYHVSKTIYYRAFYLNESDAHRRELIKDLDKYLNYTPITSDYFYYQKGTDYVWRPDVANTFRTFYKQILNYSNPDLLWNALNTIETTALFKLDDTKAILMIPIRVDDMISKDHNDAVMGFFVSTDAVINRIRDVTSRPVRPVCIYLNGEPVFSTMSDTPLYSTLIFQKNGILQNTKDVIGAKSSKDAVSIVMKYTNDDIDRHIGYFNAISLLAIAIIVLLIIILGYYTAKMNYRPIRELASKYGADSAKWQQENEILVIDAVIGSALEKSRLTERRLNEYLSQLTSQKEELIRQFFLLVLNNGYYPGMEDRAKALGLALPGEYYAVFVVAYDKPGKLDDVRLFKLIGDLSDDQIFLFCISMRSQDSFAVIANASEEAKFSEASELICSIGNAEGVAFKVKTGKVCEALKELPASMAYALSNTGVAVEESAKIRSGKHDASIMFQSIAALKKGDLDNALAKLEQYMQGLRDSVPSAEYRRLMYADFILTFIHSVGEYCSPQMKEKAGKILLSANDREFTVSISAFLREIHNTIQTRSSIQYNGVGKNIVAYIRDHAFEYDLDFDKLSDVFGLSSKSLRHIIKSETGKNLREYLSVLRVSKAQELLTGSSLSVSDIAQSVGYMSVSYFIKNFRNIIGSTPDKYRMDILQMTGR